MERVAPWGTSRAECDQSHSTTPCMASNSGLAQVTVGQEKQQLWDTSKPFSFFFQETGIAIHIYFTQALAGD